MKKADYRILHEGRDVTANWGPHLVSMTINDERGRLSDSVKIVLDDHKHAIALIDTGSWIDVYAGYEQNLTHFGTYQCNQILLSERARTYTITATAADFKQSLTVPTDRTYESGSLSSLVSHIAQKHGYQSKLHPSLVNAMHPHLDQLGESDMALLTRVANEHDALVKPWRGT